MTAGSQLLQEAPLLLEAVVLPREPLEQLVHALVLEALWLLHLLPQAQLRYHHRHVPLFFLELHDEGKQGGTALPNHSL